MIILVLLLLLSALVLGTSYFAYRAVFYTPVRPEDAPLYHLPMGSQYEKVYPHIQKSIDDMLARPYEPVTIQTFDGLTLFARYYHVADDAPVQIQFHGYKSSPFVDLSGGSKLAGKLGHNALVVDQRSHGKSEGTLITFGIRERRDCLCWIDYVRTRFGDDVPILLSGLSMGAATVLMAADMDLPDNVKGIIADCPYSSPKAIIQKVCRDVKLPPRLIYPFIWLGARLFGGFRLEETSAEAAVKKTSVPILLIHGEADYFVPCDMSRALQKTCADTITLTTIPGAGHGLSYLTSPQCYEEAVTAFVKKVLPLPSDSVIK